MDGALGECTMMIALDGHDQTTVMQEVIRREVERMRATRRCAFLPASISALRLRDCRSETDFDLTFAELLRYRQHVDIRASALETPKGWRGFVSTRAHQLLWRLLRFQHERLFFRQNLINSHLASLLELQVRHQAEALEELRARLAELEHAPRHADQTHVQVGRSTAS